MLQEHTVVQGERLDHLAARYFGPHPELFWRLCDVNVAMRPDEVIEEVDEGRITLPEGVRGVTGA